MNGRGKLACGSEKVDGFSPPPPHPPRANGTFDTTVVVPRFMLIDAPGCKLMMAVPIKRGQETRRRLIAHLFFPPRREVQWEAQEVYPPWAVKLDTKSSRPLPSFLVQASGAPRGAIRPCSRHWGREYHVFRYSCSVRSPRARCGAAGRHAPGAAVRATGMVGAEAKPKRRRRPNGGVPFYLHMGCFTLLVAAIPVSTSCGVRNCVGSF